MDEPCPVPPLPGQQRRVIKRYSNRKLYDTRESRYVTLLDIAEFIRAGEDVQVVDNATKEDKTDVTLALIISEELRARPKGIPLQTLRSLIRERGERLLAQLREGPIGKLVPWESEGGVLEGGSELEPEDFAKGATAVPTVVSEPAASSSPSQPASSAPSASRSLRSTLEQWQQAIDERIRAAVPNFSALSDLPQEVRRLSDRVAQLEEQIAKAKQ